MAHDREDRSTSPPADATLPWAGRRDPARLRDAWRRRSLAAGWLVADDWPGEPVDAVIDAVIEAASGAGPPSLEPASGAGPPSLEADSGAGPPSLEYAGPALADHSGLTAACAHLGRARARAGIGIAETIDDLAALFAVLAVSDLAPHREHGGYPPLRLVCSIAEGWAEEEMAELSRGGCEDPLSGLATVPYLRTRLAEVYREAEQAGTSPADTHRLLVVSLPRRPDPWHRMALAILVGHDLRAAFPGGETLSLARHHGARGYGSALALVGADSNLALRYVRLRRTIQATSGTQICMARLPSLLPEALRLVDELAR